MSENSYFRSRAVHFRLTSGFRTQVQNMNFKATFNKQEDVKLHVLFMIIVAYIFVEYMMHVGNFDRVEFDWMSWGILFLGQIYAGVAL